jgi:hypothetical protein
MSIIAMPRLGAAAAALLLAATCAIATAVPARAQVLELLSPAGAEARILRPSRTLGSVRERAVRIDAGLLKRAMARRGGVDLIRLELFPRVSATFRRTAWDRAYGGGHVWTGETSDGGEASLVVDGGRVTGQVQLGARVYRIEQAAGELHRVIEIDAARLPEGAAPMVAPGSQRAGPPPPSDHGALDLRRAPTAIEVLVAYTEAANAAPGKIKDDINLAVALANNAYRNSGVGIRLRLRAMSLVRGYDETAFDYKVTLCNLSGIDSPAFGCGAATDAGMLAFAGVRGKRDLVGADLVVLLRADDPFICGVAWLAEAPSAGTSHLGFSVTSLGCINPNFSFTHEIGHNMGLNHDRFVVSSPDSDLNYGFVNVAKRVRSIMAYNNECAAADPSVFCTRRNRFSDPNATIAQQPFGVVPSSPDAAFNARRLNQNRAGIAAYRASVPRDRLMAVR